MDHKVALRLLLLLACAGLGGSEEKSPGNSSQEFSDQDSLQTNGQRYNGHVKPKFNVNQVSIAQWEGATLLPFPHSPSSPLNVTINGTPCILFWAKRIWIRLQNHTQLDLTERTFGAHATVDVGDSNCSEDSAV
ncbi:hypothetical protein TURU_078342 [Turdus rufiventris]|nr:hypothetical protein TURU_078342 [Turdus rufiventris]